MLVPRFSGIVNSDTTGCRVISLTKILPLMILITGCLTTCLTVYGILDRLPVQSIHVSYFLACRLACLFTFLGDLISCDYSLYGHDLYAKFNQFGYF